MHRTLLLGLIAGVFGLASSRNATAETVYPEFRLTPAPPADRQVRPFERSLGRPCGYRWRATPSGTRKVRVCY